MRMNLSIYLAGIVRILKRHMAVHASLGFRRVVERPRSETGDATGLPVVIVVESANPTVVVDVRVQVHLMTCRAKVRSLASHKGLQKRSTMRFRVYIYEKVVKRLDDFVRTRGKLRQSRVFEREITLTHRAFNSSNGVTHHAPESGVCLRFVDQFTNRCVEHSAKQQRRIMTTGAPF